MATRPRNPLARAPLLGKGGVHQKSRSAERVKAKRQLRRELRRGSNTEGTDRPPRSFRARRCDG